jgi:hypothetical protein
MMNELPSDSSAQIDRETIKIDSPVKMARALGFIQNPESLHSPFRDYAQDFSESIVFVLPVEKTLASHDSKYGEGEQVFLGVQLKKPCQIWSKEDSVVSDAFLNWFIENGGNPQLAQEVRLLTDKAGWDWIDKKVMRGKGYRLIAQIIKQAEALGYFEYRLGILTGEFENKKTIAEAGVKEFLEAFPQYSLFSNRFNEEKTFYAAKPAIKKGRIQAMEIKINPPLGSEDKGIFEFQLGSMKVDEEGNLSSFFKVDPPVLPSTGKYQQRWFKGDMAEIVKQAIEARKNILTELGK